MHTLAIIGAGFSGTMVAAHLLRARAVRHILLFERSGRFTAGVAYGTSSAAHMLNVPAGRMSAFPDDADHFLRWAQSVDASITGASFVQRQLYGRYLADLLDDAEREAGADCTLTRVPREVTDIRKRADGRLDVVTANGETHVAQRAVIAIGNFPPAHPLPIGDGLLDRPWYARDPWTAGALDVPPAASERGAPKKHAVLLLGTGLTMLDVALSLRDRQHHGTIYAVSRRGLLPQPHRRAERPPPTCDTPASLPAWSRTARGILNGLRSEVQASARRGVDWREVVTAIRHETPALWQSVPMPERRRFLRHLRPYWETHRHRAAPIVADDIQTMIDSRWLVVVRGRVLRIEEMNDSVHVTVRRRAQGTLQKLHVHRVINCTGPDTDLARVNEPLIAQLRTAGTIRPDPLGLGLDTDEHGAVIDATGRASDRLFLVGPLRKGQLWENTAVPELRVEAAALARFLQEH
jgi:uncharacterized NAD(P)/FAD-binding protein YdhS